MNTGQIEFATEPLGQGLKPGISQLKSPARPIITAKKEEQKPVGEVKDLTKPDAQAEIMKISRNVGIAAVVAGVTGYVAVPFIKMPRIATALGLAAVTAIITFFVSKKKTK